MENIGSRLDKFGDNISVISIKLRTWELTSESPFAYCVQWKQSKMLDLFRSVIIFFRRRRTHTDCLLFQLHHRLTVCLLLLFCLVVGFRQYLWSPIVCYGDYASKEILDAYCWTHSTFTYEVHPNQKSSFAGIYKESGENPSYRFHRYYQWVVLCLFFQVIINVLLSC